MTGWGGAVRRVRSALDRVRAEAMAFTLPRVDPARIIVLCHCHHPDLATDFGALLHRLPAGATVHVSSSDPAAFEAWAALDRPAGLGLHFHRIENRGRDIRPFVLVARKLDLAPDALVLKVHAKKSVYSPLGSRWRRDLLHGLLPRGRAMRRIAARFDAAPRLGMLGAPGSFVSHPVYWGQNRAAVGRILTERFGGPPAESELGFFAGSMVWIRGALLRDLLPAVDVSAFEPEPLAQDGTYPHALERALPMAARRLGWLMGELGRAEPLDPAAVLDRRVNYL